MAGKIMPFAMVRGVIVEACKFQGESEAHSKALQDQICALPREEWEYWFNLFDSLAAPWRALSKEHEQWLKNLNGRPVRPATSSGADSAPMAP